jgi:hypothetical protein
MRRNAVGSFLPEVRELFLSDPTLSREVISLLLSNHFPESIHEDILAAVHLDQVPTAKPKEGCAIPGRSSARLWVLLCGVRL